MGRLQSAQDILARTGAGVNKPAGAQFLESCAVKFDTLTLVIRSERTTAVRAFLPLETEPAQIFEHRGNKLRFAAIPVEVFVAQDQTAVRGQGALLGNPESASMSKVQQARGRWGEAAAVTDRWVK